MIVVVCLMMLALWMAKIGIKYVVVEVDYHLSSVCFFLSQCDANITITPKFDNGGINKSAERVATE